MNQVIVRLLKDGSGRVCIHFFVHDPPPTKMADITARPILQGSTGYIACRKQRDVSPQLVNGVWEPCPHSNEARAVTCPACMATEEWKKTMESIGELEQSAANPTMDPRILPKAEPVQVTHG